MWSLSPFFQFLVGCIAVIPHIPLIKGKVNALFAMLFRTDSVADADYAGNKVIHPFGICKKIRGVISSIAVILVKGHIIHQIIALVQNRVLPISKCRHHQIGASTGNRLDLRIQHFHNAGGLRCCSSIFICSLMSHLPGTIHLISKTPGPDIVRLCVSVRLTHIAVIGTAFEITVFQKISGFLRSSCAKINCHHHIGIRFLRPVHKLIQTKMVILDHAPRQLRSGWS